MQLINPPGQGLRSLPVYHPDFGQAQAILEPRPTLEDEAFTAQTVRRMVQYAAAASTSPAIRSAAMEATQGRLDQASQAAGIWAWIRRRIRFREDAETARPIAADPENTEVLIPPAHLLRMRKPAGDCDDFSMLAAAMLLALGIPASFRTVAANPASDRYSHVYVVAHTKDGRLPLDCSHGPYPGWEVRATGKARDWSIDGPMGLGQFDYGDETAELPGGKVSSINWNSIIETSVGATASILKNRFGQPNLNPGTYVDAKSGIMYRQPSGASDFAFPGVSIGAGPSGSSSWLLLAGVGLILFLAVPKR